MKINLTDQNLITIKQIWLEDIEGVSDELTTYLLEDSTDRFRFLLVDNSGDTTNGVIDVKKLGEILGDQDEELDNETFREELNKLWEVANKQNINEIIFN